jgi:hypothetical protein
MKAATCGCYVICGRVALVYAPIRTDLLDMVLRDQIELIHQRGFHWGFRATEDLGHLPFNSIVPVCKLGQPPTDLLSVTAPGMRRDELLTLGSCPCPAAPALYHKTTPRIPWLPPPRSSWPRLVVGALTAPPRAPGETTNTLALYAN